MPLKKKNPNAEDMEVSEDSDSSDGSELEEHNEEIQVDFEGRNPIDSDFGGIRQLLNQLLLKSDVNMSELADYIIGQNYIGSVVTQCEDDEDEDEDDDMADANMVFGITTAINLNKSEVGCINQLRNLIAQKAKESATIEVHERFKNIFENTSNVVGFLLNERYVNIPPQIAVPLMESLVNEIDRANRKKMPFKFTHYAMLLKFYKRKLKKSKGQTIPEYSNAEEEIVAQNSCIEFEFAAQTENEPASIDVVPFRKVVVFEAAKLPQIIESIKTFIE
ncbi:protein BCCIP homolog [Bradysia coprophila]|uniref:protein BCCIP homolog n=1 Tax=Bradysia coprophila TaxID=38358 RepID=UPI00187DD3AF|nr:protein BCCIP homolog [Bradysia coprophila]